MRRFLILAAALAATLAVLPADAEATTPPGPTLQVPTATLAAALHCSSDLATSPQTPVLLIPGTVESSAQVYSWGYQRVLTQQGHAVCTIDRLPSYGLLDVQTSAEYVVYAIRTMYAAAGRKISLLGHSQGGFLQAWALRFWPDLAGMVDDSITLESPYGGTHLGDLWCATAGSCPPFAWQAATASNTLAALRHAPLPGGPSYTAIGSLSDELTSGNLSDWAMPGLTPTITQNLCPGRLIGHVTSLYDNADYAIVEDALNHPGGADLSRINSSVCGQSWFDGIDWTGFGNLAITLTQVLQAVTDFPTWVGAEPMVRPYAAGQVGDTNLALNRPVSVSSTQWCCDDVAASYAVDGDLNTRWGSEWWTDPEWLRVDLGSVKTVDAVQMRWEDAYATAYTVQVSNDGSTWTNVYGTTSGHGGTELVQLPATQARYVRLRMTQRADSRYGYSLYELQVIGH